jgi:hypothetical protein
MERRYAANTLFGFRKSVNSLTDEMGDLGINVKTERATMADYVAGGWKEGNASYLGYDYFGMMGKEERMGGAPTKVQALGLSFEPEYKHFSWAPGLDEEEMERWNEFIEQLQEKMKVLMEQAAQMAGTAFGEALMSTSLTGALDSFEKSLKEQIYNAALGGLTDAFLQTEIFEQKMAPLMATMAEAFGPDVTIRERKALLESLIAQAQEISTSPEMQDLVWTGQQMQEILRKGLLDDPGVEPSTELPYVTDFGRWGELPGFAGGAVVTEPTLLLQRGKAVGIMAEEGPERIGPVEEEAGIYIDFRGASFGSDPRATAEAVVGALEQAKRRKLHGRPIQANTQNAGVMRVY